MSKPISKTLNFRIGMPADNFSSEYPELLEKGLKSVSGQQLYSIHNVKTWEDFFKKNPLKLVSAKVYYVYEIGEDGSLKSYVTEGQPQAYNAKGLADEYQREEADSYYKKENARLTGEIERLLGKIDALNEVAAARDREIKDLTATTEKWWKEDKIPYIQEIAELKNKLEMLQYEKESSIQALNDQFEAQKKEDIAISEKELTEARFRALEEEKQKRSESLAGYGEIASAVAVPLLGKLGDTLLNLIAVKYPNLIPSIAEKLGGDATPAQPQQQQQYELNPATAFAAGQGNTPNT